MTNEAFGQVYEELRPRLLTTLRWQYGLSPQDAEDMVQNMVVGLLERPALLGGGIVTATPERGPPLRARDVSAPAVPEGSAGLADGHGSPR
jgi:hypothetical protein